MAARVKGSKNSNSGGHGEQAARSSLAQPRPAEPRLLSSCPQGGCVCVYVCVLGGQWWRVELQGQRPLAEKEGWQPAQKSMELWAR